ncbi:MAG: hypothetical protein KA004_00025 [Verrucomicrobiales bacterium]|nr:hypothetical protein [Verrucomicrobiales bacterium]
MKKAYITLLTVLGLAGFSSAGVTGKAPVGKTPPPPPPAGCSCFEPGGQFSLFAAAMIGDGGELDDSLGGGISAAYFFTPYVGLEGEAAWFAEDSVVHSFTGSLVLRAPITSICLAPYIMVGGGVHANSVTQGVFHAGGGLDYRFSNCIGLFADARYVWAEETDNYVIVRSGFRMNF